MAPVPPSLPPPPFKTPFDEQPGTALNLPDWFRTWLAGQRPSRAWLQWFNKLVALPEPFATYTPVVTAGSGTFTIVSATGRYRRVGKLVFIEWTVTITNAGTAVNPMLSLPFATISAIGPQMIPGVEVVVNGKACHGVINQAGWGDTSHIQIRNFDNTNAAATGAVLVLQGFYEIG